MNSCSQAESDNMVADSMFKLKDILNETQVDQIIKSAVGHEWQVIRSEVRPAADGLSGFLGDHFKLALHVQLKGETRTVHLFVKRLPVGNKPKADFIESGNYFRREQLVYQLSQECNWIRGEAPWGVKAYIYTDSLFVLPDLSTQGYSSGVLLETYDLPHMMLVVTAVARFHANFANYETKNSINGSPSTVIEEHGDILAEPTFNDSPWLHAAAKLTKNFLIEFSEKYKDTISDVNVLSGLFISACDSLKEHTGTLNVLIHKDLWTNNIMFKYDKGEPSNAVLIDYQCIRYGPPAFDLMILLYLNSTKTFRREHEETILHQYYTTFSNCIDEETRGKLKELGYDKTEFLSWCERARMFGMFEAIGILPFVLMDPKTAEETFDDPETYEKVVLNDRTRPVLAYSYKCKQYRERNLEVSEEFVERYVLKQNRSTNNIHSTSSL